MALSVFTSGTQTAVISTEHTLATTSAAGIYVALIDLGNMASGDTVEIRMKTKVLVTGTLQTETLEIYTDAQVEPNKSIRSIPIVTDTPLILTLKQTSGTGRAYDYKVLAF